MSTATIPTSTSDVTGTGAGLHLSASGRGKWRVVHTRTGLHLPMVKWPTDDLPRGAAEVVLAILVHSGIDWTRNAAELRADMGRVGAVTRDAAVIARALPRRARA